MFLSEIHVYPIKSIGGMALDEAVVERRGLQYDRRWMLVDERGKFVTQREIPEMALLGTRLEGSNLVTFVKNRPSEQVAIPLEPELPALAETMVEVWSARCRAKIHPDEINAWFSDTLKQNLRLVYMPPSTRRAADGRYAPKGQYVSFADAFPFLLIGQASLDDLNRRLAEPLPMNRFRPNFVCQGSTPYAEDEWAELKIGDALFKGVKPCGRCSITTTDQETAVRAQEPLKTLATYRMVRKSILFGQDLVWLDEGERGKVRVGDAIEVV